MSGPDGARSIRHPVAAIDRRHAILERVAEEQTIHVGPLARDFAVSEMTIRRDIRRLERDGFLRQTYGGATAHLTRSLDLAFNSPALRHAREKRLIGMRATALLEHAGLVFVGIGTTAEQFARYLPGRPGLTVVTPSVPIGSLLGTRPIRIVATGGEVRRDELSCIGPVATATLGRYTRRLGLPDGVPVVIGGADSQACALGAGVVEPGPVSEMAGSSTCLNAVVAEPLPVVEITHYPHVVPGWFTTETGLNTTGAAVAWLADLVYGGRRRRARGDDYATLDREAREVPPGADGVLVLAVLADGERTDPDLRAAFTGLSLRHDRRVLARAVLEGAALAMRAQLELLARAGAPPTELRVSGGDSRLAAWNRIKADVTGLVVRTVPGDAASAGVAMLAGLGAGLYRDVADALRSCVRPDPPIAPDPGAADRYGEVYARYLELASSPVVRRPTDSES